MKVLVTGAKGFIGQNLIATLKQNKEIEIYEFGRTNTEEDLLKYTKDCSFVFHLAGINRPINPEEFMEGNYALTDRLLKALKINQNKASILLTSSIQAELENDYGISKKAGEEVLQKYSKETDTKVYIYRLPNVFGKWCKPNYNSAVATFCYNIANELPIQVNNKDHIMNLVYIDDVVREFIKTINKNIEDISPNADGNLNKNNDLNNNNKFCIIPEITTITLGEIADLIENFPKLRTNLGVPVLNRDIEKQLYSTYLSYLPKEKFSYQLKMNVDNRGSFTEFIKTPERGQVSINVSKPGITKGNHWHHTKTEKFMVVSGTGLIQFRQINSEEIIEYRVSGENLEVVDIPTGYTHNIINVGTKDLVTVMWANEAFDPQNPDTFFLEV